MSISALEKELEAIGKTAVASEAYAVELSERRRRFRVSRNALLNGRRDQQLIDLCREALGEEMFRSLCGRINLQRAELANETIMSDLGPAPAAVLREIAETEGLNDALEAGVTASVQTLNDGVLQLTAAVDNPELRRKHRARLKAALLAMAAALDVRFGRPPLLHELKQTESAD